MQIFHEGFEFECTECDVYFGPKYPTEGSEDVVYIDNKADLSTAEAEELKKISTRFLLLWKDIRQLYKKLQG